MGFAQSHGTKIKSLGGVDSVIAEVIHKDDLDLQE